MPRERRTDGVSDTPEHSNHIYLPSSSLIGDPDTVARHGCEQPAAQGRVHIAPAKPRKKLSQYSGEEKRQVAATRIQATWRGFVERKDLDYWDQYADFY